MNKARTFEGDNRLLAGIFLSVITFWLFANSLVNVVPTLQESFDAQMGVINAAVSLTALLCGLLVVGAGGLADKYGRMKLTYIGLILSIIGSALIIIPGSSSFLIIGRAIQGISGACIMPATLAIINTYYIGTHRQRALTYWSIGSWGGSGICSVFGGFMATYVGWRSIFIISIIVALLSMLLIKHTPESKAPKDEKSSSERFDFLGLILLVVAMLSINMIITQASDYGLFSFSIMGLSGLFLLSLIAFIIWENKYANPLIDFNLFKHKGYTGATLSNFLLNAVFGTTIVANTYFQSGLNFKESQAGYITLTYLISVLLMIPVGEKVLQVMGPKRPMMIGASLNALGIILLMMVFLPPTVYVTTCIIGYLIYGLGLGMYATPSTDTAVSTAPDDKVGVASGVYKMASSLGNSFGLAISSTLFSMMSARMSAEVGITTGLGFNLLCALLALILIWCLVPKGK
ncbi:MFS transporter [Staphylococcus sp. SQ8-PEA]|uniref:Quinolone resistance protein NorB n=1 Tax=Staphylococcus marylandisciuri TaxID=2981529 RepID=A0ABT2QMW2_9STAP|nr:MFS transporter [Staphylococcus marylandisciuri]MCU5745301.1 MFS transporter [Staphylococcus marylandisciuri]